KGRSQDLDLLVGVPRPDLRNRKTPQTNDAASVDGHQSSEMAPVPTGILGRLWRVPVLGPCLQGIDVVHTSAQIGKRSAQSGDLATPRDSPNETLADVGVSPQSCQPPLSPAPTSPPP